MNRAGLEKARSRARSRRQSAGDAPAQKPRIRVMAVMAEEPPPAPAEAARKDNVVVLPIVALDRDEDAPFDPPDESDPLGLNYAEAEEEEEEETFAFIDTEALAPEEDADASIPLAEEPEPASASEDAPFDPPEADDEGAFGPASLKAEAHEPAPAASANENASPPPAEARPARLAAVPKPNPIGCEQPVPPITIHASWDRPEIARLIGELAADRRMARADIRVERGGVDAAAAYLADNESPDLLIIDSALAAEAVLAGIDRIAPMLAPKTRVIVVGAVNDIALLRDLSARGAKYVVPPIRQDDLVRCVCALYAEVDASHVIAVMGARGGVGASTIAHAIAWSIAERQDARAALVDLDIAFGVAGFGAQTPTQSLEALLDAQAEAAATPGQLQIVAAPATLARDGELDAETMAALLARMRRATPFVVLDLPHAWNAGVKHALAAADEVVVVASPDLASLRNTDAILKQVKAARAGRNPAHVVLSMIGVPKRPEIRLKDFTDALSTAPAMAFAFDPALAAAAARDARAIGEAAPNAKMAQMIDALASLLTGREPVKKKRRARDADPAPAPMLTLEQAAPPAEPVAPPLDLTEPAPAQLDDAALDARVEAFAARRVRPQTRRRTSPLSVAAAIGAMVLLGVVHLQSQRPAPAAASDIAAAPTPPAEDIAALHARAVALIEANEHAAALPLLQRAAEAGFARAQYRLAKLYESGQGVAADLGRARAWTERAAAAGHVRAMHDLGVYFARGESVAADDDAAFRWFRQAAEFGLADSQFNLGVFYQSGRGVAEDRQEALFWFLLAGAQGDEAAAGRALELEALLSPTAAQQARERALAFRPRPANAAANDEADA